MNIEHRPAGDNAENRDKTECKVAVAGAGVTNEKMKRESSHQEEFSFR